jgi:hypothetical protein
MRGGRSRRRLHLRTAAVERRLSSISRPERRAERTV